MVPCGQPPPPPACRGGLPHARTPYSHIRPLPPAHTNNAHTNNAHKPAHAEATRRGLGAALLRKPTKLARLVAGIAAGSPLPLTVKIRTGGQQQRGVRVCSCGGVWGGADIPTRRPYKEHPLKVNGVLITGIWPNLKLQMPPARTRAQASARRR